MITKPHIFAQLHPLAWRKRALALCLALCALGLNLSVSAQEPKFTTFDVAGSSGTNPSSINPAGVITGYYLDTRTVRHGFLRAPDGTITTFDPPGSGWTSPSSINPTGAITGSFHGGAV